MKSLLHILHLEDNANDAALIHANLRAGGITFTARRVQTHADFVAAIEEGGIDLILSDYSLPQFDGLSALKIAYEKQPDVPVIMVSGTLGEELAINSLKSGATDYVLKESLARLVPAVNRAMKEVDERIERRRLEAQFIEGQKMEVIGQLAGGVAHDFNNILGVILGYSELLSSDLDPDSPLLRFTEEIRLAAVRAAGLTRQLLIFGRKQTVQSVVLDLNDVVKDMDQMLRRLIDANIELSIVIEQPLGSISADSGYVGQVLMNLAVNARDAMPDGGQLTIRTSNITLAEDQLCGRPGAMPGNYVLLSISDTGTGMTDEVQAHMFEAFYTTKALGKGTGLGLVTCQTIVHLSGGLIDVSSELGKGTTFKVYFPRIEQAAGLAAKPPPHGPLPRGAETVLVVEDDQAVRHLACSILKVQGYQVLSASNGRDALNAVRDHKEAPIRLVVTDVIMPVMGGKVMADWLQAIYPDVKVLFTSGYTDEAIAHHGVLEKGVEFLHKPYMPATLVRKVREILDKELAAPPA